MKYLKYLKSAILGKKLFVFLTIIQSMVIGFVFIALANSLYKTTYKEKDLENNINISIDELQQLSIYGDMSNVREFMNKVEAELKVGSYYYYSHHCNKNNEEWEIPTLDIDKNMYDILSLEIVKGRGLKEEDFGHETIKRIVLPERYINEFQLGEIMEMVFDEEIQVEIVGFFKENVKWLPDQSVEYIELIDIRDKGVAAYTKKDTQNVSFYDMTGMTTYIIDEMNNIQKVVEKVDFINREYNYNVEVLTVRERIERYRQESKILIMQEMFFLIFVTITALIGLILNILWTISVRKKEFGTRIAVGFTIKDIQKLLIIENLIIGGIGIIIGMTIKYIEIMKEIEFLAEGGVGMVRLPNSQIMIVFVIILLIIAITSYFATKGLKNISIKDMIGCDE